MKLKRFVWLFFLSCLLFVLPTKVNALNNDVEYVIDESYILSDEELEDLSSKAEMISQDRGCGVYIIVVDDYVVTTGIDNVDLATGEVYDFLNYGVGEDKSGILLLLSMKERDYCLYAYGFGNTAFTDYGKEYLSKQFLDYFKEDDYFGGFHAYLDVSDKMLNEALLGTPVDVNHKLVSEKTASFGFIGSFVIGLLVSCIVILILKGKMKSVAIHSTANNFMKDGGIVLDESYDRFLQTTITRKYSPQEKSSSSGGTSINSSGGSSHSGKF